MTYREINRHYCEKLVKSKEDEIYAIGRNCISSYWSIFDWKKFVNRRGPTGPLPFRKERTQGIAMRYHYEKPAMYSTMYGVTHSCDHPVYSECTLFTINNIGLCVIQQRYSNNNKSTYWTSIDPWLIDELYLHPKFESFFYDRAGECVNGIYPTVTIRQLMWGLKMKPLPRQRWETCFDRRLI